MDLDCFDLLEKIQQHWPLIKKQKQIDLPLKI